MFCIRIRIGIGIAQSLGIFLGMSLVFFFFGRHCVFFFNLFWIVLEMIDGCRLRDLLNANRFEFDFQMVNGEYTFLLFLFYISFCVTFHASSLF